MELGSLAPVPAASWGSSAEEINWPSTLTAIGLPPIGPKVQRPVSPIQHRHDELDGFVGFEFPELRCNRLSALALPLLSLGILVKTDSKNRGRSDELKQFGNRAGLQVNSWHRIQYTRIQGDHA